MESSNSAKNSQKKSSVNDNRTNFLTKICISFGSPAPNLTIPFNNLLRFLSAKNVAHIFDASDKISFISEVSGAGKRRVCFTLSARGGF